MYLLNRLKNKFHFNYRKKRWPGLINAYKQYLPVSSKTPIVSLNEGNTPLIFSKSLSDLIGNNTKVYLKENPNVITSIENALSGALGIEEKK